MRMGADIDILFCAVCGRIQRRLGTACRARLAGEIDKGRREPLFWVCER